MNHNFTNNNENSMKLEEMALLNRADFEKELRKMCPYPEETQNANTLNPNDWDQVFHERTRIRSCIQRLRIEALLEGKLTVEQVVEQEHSDSRSDEELDMDGMHRGLFNSALEDLKNGVDREEIIYKTEEFLELI